MAWSYSDYEEQTTNATRLTALRRHISEVNVKVSANLSSAGGDGRQSDPLVNYLRDLNTRRRELEKKVGGVDSDDPRVTSGFTRGRVI